MQLLQASAIFMQLPASISDIRTVADKMDTAELGGSTVGQTCTFSEAQKSSILGLARVPIFTLHHMVWIAVAYGTRVHCMLS